MSRPPLNMAASSSCCRSSAEAATPAGEIVATGTPEQAARAPRSYTGQFQARCRQGAAPGGAGRGGGVSWMEIGFSIGAYELAPKDDQALKDINAALARLSARRKEEIWVTGPLARSKLAWKITGYQQALLYRIVMLAMGAAETWNSGNLLTTILAGRALVETVAVLHNFTQKIAELLRKEDLPGIDALVMKGTFASRDGQWLEAYPETQAVNVVTLIDRLDRRGLKGIRNHYDMLSERCHPNSMGHHQLFASTDKSDGTVRFSVEKRGSGERQSVIASALLLPFVEQMMDELDQAILSTADLQHRLDPVGGVQQ